MINVNNCDTFPEDGLAYRASSDLDRLREAVAPLDYIIKIVEFGSSVPFLDLLVTAASHRLETSHLPKPDTEHMPAVCPTSAHLDHVHGSWLLARAYKFRSVSGDIIETSKIPSNFVNKFITKHVTAPSDLLAFVRSPRRFIEKVRPSRLRKRKCAPKQPSAWISLL